MKKYFNKEVTIAFVTLASLGLLYFGLNYLKGANIFKPTNTYFVRMPNVSELQNSCPVFLDGFKVGIVSSISYDFGKGEGIIVQISLDSKMRVETGSYVENKTGLTSGAYLDLKLNKYVSTYHQVGDTIEGKSEKGIMDKVSEDLIPQFENIVPRLDSILAGIQLLLNHPALSQTFEQIATTTENLEKSTRQLNTMLSKDIPPIIENFNRVSSDFSVVSSKLKEIDMNTPLLSLENSLKSVEQLTLRLNSKDNSLGLLLNDRLLYDNLDSTFVNAANLLLDLRLNPKRYVHFSIFGKRQ